MSFTTIFVGAPARSNSAPGAWIASAQIERCGKSIRVYFPYLAETQDAKQYRLAMDQERWFSVIMGEKFNVDARST